MPYERYLPSYKASHRSLGEPEYFTAAIYAGYFDKASDCCFYRCNSRTFFTGLNIHCASNQQMSIRLHHNALLHAIGEVRLRYLLIVALKTPENESSIWQHSKWLNGIIHCTPDFHCFLIQKSWTYATNFLCTYLRHKIFTAASLLRSADCCYFNADFVILLTVARREQRPQNEATSLKKQIIKTGRTFLEPCWRQRYPAQSIAQ